MPKQLFRRGLKTVVLAAVLAVTLVAVPDAATPPADTALVKVERAQGVDVTPDVIWIVAVGSDARPGQSLTSTRGDALQIVGINEKTGAAAAIGIPRDSWVSIPGHGYNKINSALYFGGPQLMADAVGNLVGIEPDYVLVTGFKGLQRMVSAIGGRITVHNPRAFWDENIKPRGFKAGTITLAPYDVLAFSRIRHNLPAGDFDRSANQQRALRGILAAIKDRSDRPGLIEAGVLSVMQNTATDLNPSELFEIAQAIAQVEARKVTTCVVQGGIGNIGGASVVLPNVEQARRYGDAAREDATLQGC